MLKIAVGVARVAAEAWFVLVAIPVAIAILLGACASPKARDDAFWGKATPQLTRIINGTSQR